MTDNQRKTHNYDTSESVLAIIDFICSLLTQITLYIGQHFVYSGPICLQVYLH